MSRDAAAPIRIAVVNDYPVVVMGLRALLHTDEAIFSVEQIGWGSVPDPDTVDIILVDAFARSATIDGFLDQARRGVAKVVVLTHVLQPQAIVDSLRAGVAGYLYKGVSLRQLFDALIAVHRGTTPVVDLKPDESLEPMAGRWPGQDQGLSERESEVIALICQGRTNEEIADRLYLSVNSIKTYVRLAYRKIEVDSRTKAVAWGLAHGFTGR